MMCEFRKFLNEPKGKRMPNALTLEQIDFFHREGYLAIDVLTISLAGREA